MSAVGVPREIPVENPFGSPAADAAVTVPGNLLLMGEYAVLEEGGLGLAIAPDIRASGSLSTDPGAAAAVAAGQTDHRTNTPLPTPNVSVIGKLPGETVSWPGDTGVLGLAAEYLNGHFTLPGGTGSGLRIELESDAFFRPDGGKRGLGSSAAIVVALTALWLRAFGSISPGSTGEGDTRETVFRNALAAHRSAQGGRGSGYDVAGSTFGGILLFTGGVVPRVTPLNLRWLPRLRLLQGTAPVRTVNAVGRFSEWESANSKAAGEFLERSNRMVAEFASANDWTTAAEVLAEYTRIAVALGESIGVPATANFPGARATARLADNVPVVAKAVGAGNELGVVLGEPNANIAPSSEGLVWS